MPKDQVDKEIQFGPDQYDYISANKGFNPDDKVLTIVDDEPDDTRVVVTDDDDYVEDVFDEEEQLARSQGWLPKDEYEGDPGKWVDAREFNFRGELMGRISSQGKQISTYSKEIEELKKSLKILGEHNKKIAEMERKKALESLRQQKIDALANDDHEAAVDIDDKIQDIKATKIEDDEPEETTKVDPNKPHPDFVAWVNNPTNSWYSANRMLRGFANVIAQEYAAEHNAAADPDNFDVPAMMEHVSKQMRVQFPEHFGRQRKNHSPAVNEPSNNGNTPRKNKKKYSERDLDETQREVGRTFVRAGAYKSIQEYVDQLAELGEIPTQRGV